MNTTPETEAPEFLESHEMITAGLSPRQLDHWATKHYLRPDTASPGSGYPRRWPLAEYDVARLMVRLIAAGLTVDAASIAARVAIEQRLDQVVLADGITLTVREAE